jgi:type II secretory pathway pseudopilin PulG
MRAGSRARRRHSAASGQAGYNLVAVVMLITVMSILVAAVLPLWSSQIRRDKEEELISRGLQYAEAIRVFQRRFGRLPVRLEELVEVEPRSIRRLWTDPMTGEMDWVRIFEGVPPGGFPVDPETGEPMTDPDGDGVPGEGETTYVGPIRGVRSRVSEEGFQVFLDQTNYSQWEFRSDVFSRYRVAPTELGIPRHSALTIGRPFRHPPPGGPAARPGTPPAGGPPGGPGGASRPPQPKPPAR